MIAKEKNVISKLFFCCFAAASLQGLGFLEEAKAQSHLSGIKPQEVVKEVAKEGAEAEEKKEEKKEDNEKIKPGVIASFGVVVSAGSVKTSQTGVSGEKLVSPISARISPKGDKCEILVSNTSAENAYSFSFSAKSSDKAGRSIASNSYSATLQPGGSTTKTLRCKKGGGMQVVLKSGRRI